ncbi:MULTISPECIES: hypothetical protein [Acetobacter]|uniref:hypothetical protein n=1 Tax=Acetobacter TaxID=434 RepID=UPI0006821E6A|nr:hypothetical protein [Acetobacter pasteurianus]ALR88188.1 hypothetical protein DB34_13575 [Acetobacter pasteurianus]
MDAEEKPAPAKPSSPRLSVMAEKFIYSDTTKSPDTLKATRKTIDLFIEAFGDKPIRHITGTVAGEFFDLLSSLPATHGKGKTVLPLRMVIAQAQEQGQETVSGKTVKNHFSRMSSLWSHLVQRDLVDKNPWAGIITIGMFTGMRLGEICNLRRQDIEVIDADFFCGYRPLCKSFLTNIDV